MNTKAMDSAGMPRVKVIGVGGGGSNAVSRMYEERIPQVEYIIANTDAQAMRNSPVPTRLHLGRRLTRGQGVGGDPLLGRRAAEESRGEIQALCQDADLVFVTAGMGGGTGTGAAPLIAQVAREAGALVLGVVTRPFCFEGAKRLKVGEEGIQELSQNVDALIVIPNDRLLEIGGDDLTASGAFRLADEVLRQGVRAIAELIVAPGEINVDFADVRIIMKNAGQAWMSIGHGQGRYRALEAVEAALQSPLLEVNIEGARGILLNITGSEDLTLSEVHAAAEHIVRAADPEANLIVGMAYDPTLGSQVRVTVIATGFHSKTGRSFPEDSLFRLPPFQEEEPPFPTFLSSGMRRFP